MTELERVVAAMRKVVDRLQGENNSLKKSLATAKSRKNGHTEKTALEEENSRLKVSRGKEVWGKREREGGGGRQGVCVRERERERERRGEGGQRREKGNTILLSAAELERLQAGIPLEERGDQKRTSAASNKSPYVKIVTENERLRKDLKKVWSD